jgi:hypothetical protein
MATNTIELERNRSKINETDRYSAAHNGLVAGSSPAGPTSVVAIPQFVPRSHQNRQTFLVGLGAVENFFMACLDFEWFQIHSAGCGA